MVKGGGAKTPAVWPRGPRRGLRGLRLAGPDSAAVAFVAMFAGLVLMAGLL